MNESTTKYMIPHPKNKCCTKECTSAVSLVVLVCGILITAIISTRIASDFISYNGYTESMCDGNINFSSTPIRSGLYYLGFVETTILLPNGTSSGRDVVLRYPPGRSASLLGRSRGDVEEWLESVQTNEPFECLTADAEFRSDGITENLGTEGWVWLGVSIFSWVCLVALIVTPLCLYVAKKNEK